MVKELQGLGLDVEVQYDDGTSGGIPLDEEEEKGLYAITGVIPPDPFANDSGMDMKQDNEDEDDFDDPNDDDLANDIFEASVDEVKSSGDDLGGLSRLRAAVKGHSEQGQEEGE